MAGEGRGRDGSAGHPYNERAGYVSANAGPERPHRYDLLCRGEYDLLLAPPARTDGARLNRMAGGVRVGPARGGTAPAARRFLHRAADRILPMAAGARIPNRTRAVAAHQRCRHSGDVMNAASGIRASIAVSSERSLPGAEKSMTTKVAHTQGRVLSQRHGANG